MLDPGPRSINVAFPLTLGLTLVSSLPRSLGSLPSRRSASISSLSEGQCTSVTPFPTVGLPNRHEPGPRLYHAHHICLDKHARIKYCVPKYALGDIPRYEHRRRWCISIGVTSAFDCDFLRWTCRTERSRLAFVG
jgi:hypothetical protein